MPLISVARFRVTDPRAAELAMFEHTTLVRRDHAAIVTTIYRNPEDPGVYTALIMAHDAKAEARYRDVFTAALAPHLAGTIAFEQSELVTSSDLQRRRR
ncbi:MAG: hypothetical protein ABI678_03650 [Kofleriaceae bacterium]